MEEFSEVLLDVQKEYKRSNKLKDIIIIILIVLMFLQSAFSFGCFVWYESQFEYYDTAQEENTKDVVNDSVLPKFVKNAMEQYKQWEHETKELYEEQ